MILEDMVEDAADSTTLTDRQRKAAMRLGKRASRRIWKQAVASKTLITEPMTVSAASALGAAFVAEVQARADAESAAMFQNLLEHKGALVKAINREAAEVVREHDTNGAVTARTRIRFTELLAAWRVDFATFQEASRVRFAVASQLTACYWEGVLRRRVRRRGRGAVTVGGVPVMEGAGRWDDPDRLLSTLEGSSPILRALDILK
ncbi:hypothetical protein J5X84_31595 [Streptosporangiaceae bacterium NEAU-GS5]|nr:hypothetical protein [Streptosporangiaceae bacterium NEAU-GS5]